MQLFGPAVASFCLCLLAMLALRPLAFAIDLIDRPGGRKLHKGEVPLVGGLGMLLGMVLGMGLLPQPDWANGTFLAACTLLVTAGLIDDKVTLSPWTRLAVQITATMVLIFGAGAEIATLGTMFGTPIWLEGVSVYAVTAFSVMCAINAANMLDGMDGLAGAISLVALVALSILASQGGNVFALSIGVVVIGAVAAFLVSNLPLDMNRRVHCFMGDSGSTLLGFAVALLCISVSQDQSPAVKPVTILWIVAIPLFELCWTVIRRCIHGISPFSSDQNHLHHMFLRAGFSVKVTFVTFVLLAISLAATGIMLERLEVPDFLSLALLILAGILVVNQLSRPVILSKLARRMAVTRRSDRPSSGRQQRTQR